MIWFAIVIILTINSITGRTILRYWPAIQNRLIYLFTSLSFGSAINGYILFILAELGLFRWPFIITIWLILMLFVHLTSEKNQRTKSNTFVSYLSYFALLCWLLIATFLFFRPHQFIRGGADAGIYVNLATHIAKTGRITIHDPTIATLDPALYPNLLQPQPNYPAPYALFPAIFYDGDQSDRLTPQFYHLHPVWQAAAALISGVHGALLINGVWAILGTAASALTIYSLFGKTAGLLTLIALTFNGLQLWFGRYPTTEPLTQFYIWTGLWALSRAAATSEKNPFPLLAALCFGSAMLTRIDMFFFIALPFALPLHRLITSSRSNIRHSHFSLPLILIGIHSFGHGYFLSRPYFLDTFASIYRRLSRNWELPLAIALLTIATLYIFGRLRHHRWIKEYGASLFVCPLLLLALYAQFIRPMHDPVFYNERISQAITPIMDHVNLVRLGWYLSPIGLWIGILGACYIIWHLCHTSIIPKQHHDSLPIAIFLAIGLLFTLLYGWKLQANHHQIYAMRRYVPVTVPFLIGCGAYLIRQIGTAVRGEVYERPRRHTYHFRAACMMIVAFVWLIGFAWKARGFVTQVDDKGSHALIEAMAAQVDPNGIVLFNDPHPFGQGDMIGTTLRLMHHIDLFVVHDIDTIDQHAFHNQLQHWQASGRSLYWITPTNNQRSFPLATWALSNAQPYHIQFDFLKPTYFEKPTTISTINWQGTIEELINNESSQ